MQVIGYERFDAREVNQRLAVYGGCTGVDIFTRLWFGGVGLVVCAVMHMPDERAIQALFHAQQRQCYVHPGVLVAQILGG